MMRWPEGWAGDARSCQGRRCRAVWPIFARRCRFRVNRKAGDISKPGRFGSPVMGQFEASLLRAQIIGDGRPRSKIPSRDDNLSISYQLFKRSARLMNRRNRHQVHANKPAEQDAVIDLFNQQALAADRIQHLPLKDAQQFPGGSTGGPSPNTSHRTSATTAPTTWSTCARTPRNGWSARTCSSCYK